MRITKSMISRGEKAMLKADPIAYPTWNDLAEICLRAALKDITVLDKSVKTGKNNGI